MNRVPRRDFTAFAGLLFGLVSLPLIVIVSHRQAVVAPVPAPAPMPETEIAREPDRTRPIAIMIDNHPDARPQSGVAEADVVWEALVEGGLTRDMLIFRSASATEIGPVRSARPYFLRWAREFDAVYAHVGGSDEALSDLASGKLGLDDANEFKYGSSYWRDSRRSAPHSTYTSSERLHKLITSNSWAETTDAIDTTARSRDAATGTPASRILVTYMQNGETAEFRWDAGAGGYALWRRNRLARDREGTVVMPKTLVVLSMKVVPINDPQGKGLIGIESIGSGEAMVFTDGVVTPGTWQKTSAANPTSVMGTDGQKIPFNQGQVWYAVVGANRGGGVEFTP